MGISLDCVSRKQARWDTVRQVLPNILNELLAKGWAEQTCLSVNIPDASAEKVGPMVWTRPVRGNLSRFIVDQREDLREKDYFWIYPQADAGHGGDDTDHAAMEQKNVSVTVLNIDRSAVPTHA